MEQVSTHSLRTPPLTPTATDEQIQAFSRKASTYRSIANVAEKDLADYKLANLARDCAHSYDEAVYKAVATNARLLALKYGKRDLAGRILLNIASAGDITGLHDDLREAVELWLAVQPLHQQHDLFI